MLDGLLNPQDRNGAQRRETRPPNRHPPMDWRESKGNDAEKEEQGGPFSPPERVDEIRSVLPCQCWQCGHALPQRLEDAQTGGTVRRHQVT